MTTKTFIHDTLSTTTTTKPQPFYVPETKWHLNEQMNCGNTFDDGSVAQTAKAGIQHKCLLLL